MLFELHVLTRWNTAVLPRLNVRSGAAEVNTCDARTGQFARA
jgi:hypothetical protein